MAPLQLVSTWLGAQPRPKPEASLLTRAPAWPPGAGQAGSPVGPGQGRALHHELEEERADHVQTLVRSVAFKDFQYVSIHLLVKQSQVVVRLKQASTKELSYSGWGMKEEHVRSPSRTGVGEAPPCSHPWCRPHTSTPRVLPGGGRHSRQHHLGRTSTGPRRPQALGAVTSLLPEQAGEAHATRRLFLYPQH